MKRLIALLLAFSLLSCPVFADAEEESCEHFRVWADWNEMLSTETLDGEQHRITAVCPDCGETAYRDESHVFSLSDAEAYDGEQHRTLKTCTPCGYAVYVYADHEWQYGDWQTEDGALYYRIGICTVCDTENPVLDFYEVEKAEEGETELPEETPEPMPEAAEETPPALWLEPQFKTGEPDAVYPAAVISVTVPDNLPLTATGDGYVYAIDNLSIVNHSDGAVKVTGITVDAATGWTLMPYTGSNAIIPSEVKSIGFRINGAFTTGWGSSEVLYLPGDWTIAKNASLPLRYDASVSFSEIPHEGEQVLSLTFVLDWV